MYFLGLGLIFIALKYLEVAPVAALVVASGVSAVRPRDRVVGLGRQHGVHQA